MLDWAKSAYVACFFALEEPKAPDSGLRAVWAFSQIGHLEILSNHPANYGKRREELDAIDLIHARIDENGRLISQGGVFTRTPAGEDISSFIDQNVDLSGFAPVLFRIEIPDKHRDLFLRHLELMNIHAGTLFPDLAGAASLANRQFEKESSRRLLMRQPKFLRNLGAALPTHDRTTATDQYVPFDDDGPTGTEVSTSAKARQKMKRR